MGVNKVVFGGETLIDLTDDSVTADNLAEGETAHDAAGNKITGRLVIPTVITLTSIAITTPPTKTVYGVGETFNPAGMVVKATYSNGVTAVITGYSYSPTGALASGTTVITIQYTEGGVTVSAKQSITVKKAYEATFSSNDWATIIEACQANEVPSTWKVGDSKYMSVNGFNRSVVIVGKNHDTYSSGGTAPLTFQINGHVLGKTAAMNASSSNRTGWSGCEMRNGTLWDIFDTLPSEVQDGIRYVDKLTTKGGGSSSIETTEDALFLLSEVEMFGSATISGSGEGSQYAYYAAGNSISPSEHLWFRSPSINNSTSYCGMVYYGGVSYWGASNVLGISFAFCF